VANTAQARKRVRQNIKSRAHNVSLRSNMRTYIKATVTAISEKNKEIAKASYVKLVSAVDSMVSKGIIHRNKAARHKSRLNAQIKSL